MATCSPGLWFRPTNAALKRRSTTGGLKGGVMPVEPIPLTAAEQPSIEDVILGAISGLPKVHLHNPVLAYEVGDDFMKYFYQAERGEIDPFVLVVEGSIPNEQIKDEGYWAAQGTDPNTGQPITTCAWIDRLAPRALAVWPPGPARPTAAFTPWP